MAKQMHNSCIATGHSEALHCMFMCITTADKVLMFAGGEGLMREIDWKTLTGGFFIMSILNTRC